jgi:hypothetical protein
MSEILAAISLVLGFSFGWLLRSIFVMAAISRSQEYMERKVRYWQSETARARASASHLRRLLAAASQPTLKPSGGDWGCSDGTRPE